MFIYIRGFKSHGGLHSNEHKKELGARARESPLRITFKDYGNVAVICCKKKMLFCSYHRRFLKDKSPLGSQTGNNSFHLEGLKKHKNALKSVYNLASLEIR